MKVWKEKQGRIYKSSFSLIPETDEIDQIVLVKSFRT